MAFIPRPVMALHYLQRPGNFLIDIEQLFVPELSRQ